MRIGISFILSCIFSFLHSGLIFGAELNVAVKNEASTPVNLPTPSSIAEYIIHSPLDDDFFALLSDIEHADESYKTALKSELVNLQRTRFCRGLDYVKYPLVGWEHIALNYIGDSCASTKDDNSVWMFNREVFTFPSGIEKKIAVSFNDNDKEMALLTEKYVKKAKKLALGASEFNFTTATVTFPASTTCLGFSEAGTYILCSRDQEFYMQSLRDINERAKRIPLAKHPFPAQIALDAEGKIAIIASTNEFYIIKINRECESTPIECKNIKRISLAAQGNRLAIQHEHEGKQYIAFYDINTGRLEGKLLRPDITAMALSPCGRYIVMGFKSGALLLYNIADRQQGLVGTLTLSVKNITWSGNSRVIAALTDQECYVLSLDSRADALPLDAIILVSKAYTLSTENILSHAYFKNAYEKLKKASNNQATITITALSDLKPCNRCKNECGVRPSLCPPTTPRPRPPSHPRPSRAKSAASGRTAS